MACVTMSTVHSLILNLRSARFGLHGDCVTWSALYSIINMPLGGQMPLRGQQAGETNILEL